MHIRDHFRVFEFVVVVLTAAFTAFFYLDSIHADRKDYLQDKLELKKQIIVNELNRDHFARRRYEQLIRSDEAAPADYVRYDYIMLDIKNKESEKALVDAQLKKLEQ